LDRRWAGEETKLKILEANKVVKCEEMRVRFVETIHICSPADNKMGEIKKKSKDV